MNQKVAKKVWTVIAIIGVLAMVLFTILPLFS